MGGYSSKVWKRLGKLDDAQQGNQPDRPTAALRLLLPGRLLPALGDSNVKVPGYIYLPLGLQFLAEVAIRIGREDGSFGLWLTLGTLLICIYVGARGLASGRSVVPAAAWSLPITILNLINGSLGFAVHAEGYKPGMYATFLVASVAFCLLGLCVSAIAGVSVRVMNRLRRTEA